MLRAVILILLGAVFVMLGVANMAPVTVHLLPPGLGVEEASLSDVPLSAVLLGAGVAGVVVGQLMEWLRETEHRRQVAEKHREVGRLRREIRRLTARLSAREGGSRPDTARR